MNSRKIQFLLWFPVLALTYKEKEAESRNAVAALAHLERMT